MLWPHRAGQDKDNQEIETAHDSCWGYVGCDYAKERVLEEFDLVVKKIENELLPGINPEPVKEPMRLPTQF